METWINWWFSRGQKHAPAVSSAPNGAKAQKEVPSHIFSANARHRKEQVQATDTIAKLRKQVKGSPDVCEDSRSDWIVSTPTSALLLYPLD
jgi:hypothetical protein